MRRRLLIVFSLCAAFGLGVYLASSSFDLLQDTWDGILVAWYAYRLRAGSGGTFYVMAAGFLLGQGLFLAGRQLWRGPLRRARGYFADLDAASDVTTKLPSRFALQRFLERNIQWAEEDPSTRHLSLALLRIEGLQRLNASAGTPRGTELLLRSARLLRDGSVPLSVRGPLRWLARRRLGPRLAVFGRNPPSRCPARWGGGTFGLAFRGVDARKALLVVREIVADLDDQARKLYPENGPRVRGGLCLFSAGASVDDLAAGATCALEQAPIGGVAAAHEAGEGSAPMLDEFKELPRVLCTFRRVNAPPPATEPAGRAGAARIASWAKGWGIAVACLAGGPILLSATSRSSEAASVAYPWPESLKELPVFDARGLRSTPVVHLAARPVSDGLWQVERASAMQVEPDSRQPSQSVVFVQLSLVNRSERTQHISMFDVSALDADGRRLRLDPKNSLAFQNALKSRDLEPGGRWTGWLRFLRDGVGVRALVFQPSRESRIYLPLEVAEPGAGPPRAVSSGPR